MPDAMALMINLTQIGGSSNDTRAALGMLFEFDAVFNKKTEELLKYGLGLDTKEKRAKVTSAQIVRKYRKNFSTDFNQGLWLKFRICFQLVELILRIRDKVLLKSEIKPILNGLYWIQEYSHNL